MRTCVHPVVKDSAFELKVNVYLEKEIWGITIMLCSLTCSFIELNISRHLHCYNNTPAGTYHRSQGANVFEQECVSSILSFSLGAIPAYQSVIEAKEHSPLLSLSSETKALCEKGIPSRINFLTLNSSQEVRMMPEGEQTR